MNVKICDMCARHIGPDMISETREYRLIRYKDNPNHMSVRNYTHYGDPFANSNSITEETMDLCCECYFKLKEFIEECINHGN